MYIRVLYIYICNLCFIPHAKRRGKNPIKSVDSIDWDRVFCFLQCHQSNSSLLEVSNIIRSIEFHTNIPQRKRQRSWWRTLLVEAWFSHGSTNLPYQQKKVSHSVMPRGTCGLRSTGLVEASDRVICQRFQWVDCPHQSLLILSPFHDTTVSKPTAKVSHLQRPWFHTSTSTRNTLFKSPCSPSQTSQRTPRDLNRSGRRSVPNCPSNLVHPTWNATMMIPPIDLLILRNTTIFVGYEDSISKCWIAR